jgi:hypothetical protein
MEGRNALVRPGIGTAARGTRLKWLASSAKSETEEKRMAQAAKGSALFFWPESRNNVKSDGHECPSYTNKTKVKSRGRVARGPTVGALQVSKLPSLVFQDEVKH